MVTFAPNRTVDVHHWLCVDLILLYQLVIAIVVRLIIPEMELASMDVRNHPMDRIYSIVIQVRVKILEHVWH